MAKAEVPIEDARWFHCIARRRGLLRERDVLRFRRIQSILADRICFGWSKETPSLWAFTQAGHARFGKPSFSFAEYSRIGALSAGF